MHIVVKPFDGLACLILDVSKLGIPQSLVTLESDAFWLWRRGIVRTQHRVAGSCHCFLLVSGERRQEEGLKEGAFGSTIFASVISTRLEKLIGGLEGERVVLANKGRIGRSCGLVLQGTKDCDLLCERVDLLSQPGHHRAEVGLLERSIVHEVYGRNGC
jgi:hypothetical protein